jgi:hypothetical protein
LTERDLLRETLIVSEKKDLDNEEVSKYSHICTMKVKGDKLTINSGMYSLFFVSLLNYDGQADIADKGWLELNKSGNGTMQDVFKAKYAFYCLFLYFS